MSKSPEMPAGPIDVLCRYRVKGGQASAFADLLKGHWAMLHGQGLTTDAPAEVMRASDNAGNIAFIERFAWKDADAVQAAHENATVMQTWKPMGALCENMEFWHIQAS